MHTVFVLDDDESYRELVLLTLEDHCGVSRTVGFGAGEPLLAHVEQHWGAEPDLLILDLHLGGLSGLDVLRRLRAHGVQVPVAILTGAGDAAEREACLQAGATAVIVKPVAYAELVQRLQEVCRPIGRASAA